MKLRNKKTGEIVEINTVDLVVTGYYCDRLVDRQPSLSKINEEWEDYAPKEPLIKDEKIRKAVRAWAECNLLDDDDRLSLCKPTFDCKILSLMHGMLNFDVYYDDESLCNKHYTIAELCGDEE